MFDEYKRVANRRSYLANRTAVVAPTPAATLQAHVLTRSSRRLPKIPLHPTPKKQRTGVGVLN
jgi:hypothetical protein